MGCFAILGIMTVVSAGLIVFAAFGQALLGNEAGWIGAIIYLPVLVLLFSVPGRAFKRFAGGSENLAYCDHGTLFKNIALSKDRRTVYLGAFLSRKKYPIEDIRRWILLRKAPFLGSVMHVLRVEVKDVDHPVWEIQWPREQKASRWSEILSQAVESAQGILIPD